MFRDHRGSAAAACVELGIPKKKGWDPERARKVLREDKKKDLTRFIRRIAYRPFDVRYIFYHPSLVWGMAWPTMQHIVNGPNIALISARSNKTQAGDHFFVANTLAETKCAESTTQSTVFPLYRYEGGGGELLPKVRVPNLTREFCSAIHSQLGLELGGKDAATSVSCEEMLAYIYALFYSRSYRTRYRAFLNAEFPRFPLTNDVRLFRTLAAKGAQLIALHLLQAPTLANLSTEFPVKGSDVVETVRYDQNTKRLWINDEQYIGEVAPDVWEFKIGGYQVCEKWLRYRKEEKLSHEEIVHIQQVVMAIEGTIRLMAGIDAAIPGWPLPSIETAARLERVAETSARRYEGRRGKPKRR